MIKLSEFFPKDLQKEPEFAFAFTRKIPLNSRDQVQSALSSFTSYCESNKPSKADAVLAYNNILNKAKIYQILIPTTFKLPNS